MAQGSTSRSLRSPSSGIHPLNNDDDSVVPKCEYQNLKTFIHILFLCAKSWVEECNWDVPVTDSRLIRDSDFTLLLRDC